MCEVETKVAGQRPVRRDPVQLSRVARAQQRRMRQAARARLHRCGSPYADRIGHCLAQDATLPFVHLCQLHRGDAEHLDQ